MNGHRFLDYAVIWIQVALLRLVVKAALLFAPRRTISPGASFSILKVPSRDSGRKITVHIYTPQNLTPNAPTAVVINMHASGYVIPSLGADIQFCSLVAVRANVIVFDMDYRKAPEHPFPAANEDFLDVLAYVRANKHLYDPSRILLSGFSAGATIALAEASHDSLTLSSRYAPLAPPPAIRGIFAFYPNMDRSKIYVAPDNFDSKDGHAGFVMPLWTSKLLLAASLPPGSPPPDDPRLSPKFAPRDSFPQFLYIACGSADPLHVANEEFVRSMEGTHVPASSEGVENSPRVVKFVGLQGEAHGFDKNAKAGSIAEEHVKVAYEGALEMIQLALFRGEVS